MTCPSRFPFRRRLRWGGVFALALVGAAVACGPDFPNSYYDAPEGEMLRAPEGIFAREIARIATDALVTVKAARGSPSTVEVDIADLQRALAERGVAPRLAQEIEGTYRRRRLELEARREEHGKPAEAV
ncbi:MAG: hypothetical protein ABIR80_03465, partial [Opitutaceae bacterium]